MPILEQLQNHFSSYVWQHVLSMLVGLMLLKEQFGLGDCRCRGKQSLERWVELVLLAYVLVRLTRWGKQLLGERCGKAGAGA